MEQPQRYRAGSFPVAENRSYYPQNYKSTKQQLQHQTNALLNERKHIQFQNSQNYEQPYHQNKSRGFNSRKVYESGPKSQLSEKIQDIVKICNDDKHQLRNQFQQMSDAQRKILQLLTQSRPETLELNNYEVPEHEKRPAFVEKQKQDKYRKSAIQALKTQRNFQPNDLGSNFQNIREKLQKNPVYGDDVFMMIEAIERKALIEIDALKKDKIQLLRRLNEEIRLHNEEKKLRMMLEEKLRSMGVQQHTTEPLNQNLPTNTEGHDEERRKIAMLLDQNDPQILKRKIVELFDENKRCKNFINHGHSRNRSDAGESNYLKSQISLLEKKLYEYQVEINRLRTTTQGNADLNLLYEQGEVIRKQTLNLLKKQGSLNAESERVIQNLEKRLEQEEYAKNKFLSDIERFKAEYTTLQEENRRLKGYNESPPTERNYKSYHTRATGNDRKRSSFKVKEKLGEYEDLISQIKKVSS